MRTIPQAWRQEYIKGNRKYDITVNMTLADSTTLIITNSQLWEGGFSFEQASSSDSSFDIGSAIVGSATLILDNINENFSQYDFFNAEFNVSLGLVGANLQPITIGHYTVDETAYNGSLITLSCLDNMWRFDRPFSEIMVSYPATARSIINAMCGYSGIGIQLATQSFQGYDFAIPSAPEGDMTCREVLQYVAQATCNYCVINEQGNLELKWYDKSIINNLSNYDGGSFSTNTTPYSDGVSLDGGTFDFNDGDTADGGTFYDGSDPISYITSNFSMSVDTDDIVITGVKVCTSSDGDGSYDYSWHDSTVEQTHPRYTLVIQDNPFINENNAQSRATTIGGILANTPLRGFSSSSLSDISIEVGDPCAIIDFRGNRFYSFVTNTRFTTSNSESFSCGVESLVQNKTVRYSNEIKTLVEAKRNAQEVVSEYDQAVQRMQQLAANAGGLYWLEVPQQGGSAIWYESDMPMSLDSSGNVVFTSGSHAWKKTANGFFSCTSTGTSEATTTWTAGVDNNNNAVMNTVSAIGINADWINTGTLTVGGSGVGNPSIVVKDSSNNTVVDINQNGLTAHAGVIRTADNTFYVDMASNSVRIGAGTGIYDPNANYSGSYVPTNNNYPASSWTDAEKANHIGETFTNTSTKKTYIYKVTPAAIPESNHPYGTNEDAYYRFDCPSSWSIVALTFDAQCETEGSNYDYLDFYMTGYDSGIYRYRLQGTAFAGKTYIIDLTNSHTFYLRWHADGSVTKWGWKFTVSDSGTGTDMSALAEYDSLPSASWTLINLASGGTYEWVESTITGYIDAKSGETSLTQEEVYNALTNNGQDQGLYLSGGKIYLNAQYMTSNAITIGGSQYSQKTYLQIRDSSNAIIGQWDKDGIEATAGKFGKLEIKKNASDVTYLRYINSVALIYTSQSWTGAIKANTGGMVKINPYQEGWIGNGYVHILFNMNLRTSSSSARTDAQCRIDVLRFSGGVNQGIIKTVQLRYDGKDTSGSNGLSSGEEIVVIDEETGEVIADETSSSPGYFIELDGSYGSTDGDFYKIRYRLTQRSSSYVNSASISIDDNINGSGFMVKEKSDGRASASGRFAGEFRGSFGSFETLDLGVFKYGSNGWSDGLWKIKGDGTTYGEISESQFSLHNSEDFNNSSQGIMMQQGTLERRYNSNTYTPEWTSSDRRIKRDIEPLSVELSKDFIDGTEPKSFKYRNNTEKNYGMIAQEARELLDSLGETDSALEYSIGDTDIKDQRTIAYSQYIPHLINYVKDLRSEIDGLKAEIAELKSKGE